MTIEEELTRLLHDDRLEVRPRAGATEAVVAGARRVRRRRGAVVGAFAAVVLLASGWGVTALGGSLSLPNVDPAVSLTTTTTTTSAPGTTVVPAPHTVVETVTVTVTGSSHSTVGYGAVKFGMTEQEVAATGRVTRSPGGECAAFTWNGAPEVANAVLVARGQGVVVIKLPPGGTTSAGVGVGAALEQVKGEYPAGEQYGPGRFDVPMTGDIGWEYVFTLDADKVVGIRMQRLTADCAQQGEQR